MHIYRIGLSTLGTLHWLRVCMLRNCMRLQRNKHLLSVNFSGGEHFV